MLVTAINVSYFGLIYEGKSLLLLAIFVTFGGVKGKYILKNGTLSKNKTKNT